MPKLVLDGEATILAAMKVEPQTLNFGKIDRDAKELTQTFTILQGDGGPLKPRIVTTGREGVTAELRELEPGKRYDVDVTLTPPWPNGVLRGNLTIETGVEQSPRETINYFASVVPRLTTQPNRFTIPANLKRDMDLKVRLQWAGEAGKVVDASSSAPNTTVELTEEDGGSAIVLHVPKDFAPPRRSGYAVTIKTDDPEVGVHRIPIYVLGAARPASPQSPAAPAQRTVIQQGTAPKQQEQRPASPAGDNGGAPAQEAVR